MHPTVKPVHSWPMLSKTAPVRGDIVLDPFSGSGTTIIAAEQYRPARAGDRARSPVRRCGRAPVATGRHALHAETSKTFEVLEEERRAANDNLLTAEGEVA